MGGFRAPGSLCMRCDRSDTGPAPGGLNLFDVKIIPDKGLTTPIKTSSKKPPAIKTKPKVKLNDTSVSRDGSKIKVTVPDQGVAPTPAARDPTGQDRAGLRPEEPGLGTPRKTDVVA